MKVKKKKRKTHNNGWGSSKRKRGVKEGVLGEDREIGKDYALDSKDRIRIKKASIKISRIRYEDLKNRRGTGLKEERIRD